MRSKLQRLNHLSSISNEYDKCDLCDADYVAYTRLHLSQLFGNV